MKLPSGTPIVCACGKTCKVCQGTIHYCPAYGNKRIWNPYGDWCYYEKGKKKIPITDEPNMPTTPAEPKLKHGDKTNCPGCGRKCKVNVDSVHHCTGVGGIEIFCDSDGHWVNSDGTADERIRFFCDDDNAKPTAIIYSWDFAWH
jgi:hypothetical protein